SPAGPPAPRRTVPGRDRPVPQAPPRASADGPPNARTAPPTRHRSTLASQKSPPRPRGYGGPTLRTARAGRPAEENHRGYRSTLRSAVAGGRPIGEADPRPVHPDPGPSRSGAARAESTIAPRCSDRKGGSGRHTG